MMHRSFVRVFLAAVVTVVATAMVFAPLPVLASDSLRRAELVRVEAEVEPHRHLLLHVGDTARVSLRALTADTGWVEVTTAWTPKPTWRSGSTSIAKVDSVGLVRGVAAGETTITATCCGTSTTGLVDHFHVLVMAKGKPFPTW